MKKKLTYYIAAIVAIIITQEPSSTLATTSNLALSQDLKDATTKIEQSHENLAIIKDADSLSPEEKESKEFSARKELIKTAINLSLEEVKNLVKRTSEIPKLEKESPEENLRLNYMEELSVYEKYYQSKAISIESILTSEELKEFAKSIIDYRDNIYNPSIQKIAEFLLLFYTEETINTTSARLVKMTSDIKKLESLNAIKINSFKSEIAKASELIKSAMDKYTSAKNTILKPLQKIKEEQLETEEIKTSEELIDINLLIKEPSPKELMESSLNDIKSTYEYFLQISRDVRKSIGIR